PPVPSLPASPSTSLACESLLEIGDQVVAILDAGRQPDQRIRYADRRALFRRDRPVRHDRRMLDQAFDTTKAFRKREKLCPLEEAFRSRQVAVEFERDHAAEGRHLPLRDLVLRMAG